MKKKWKELKQYPLLLLFFVFLFGFMILDGLWPKRASSELERRDLAQFPAFSWKALFANEWTADYDEYTKDQVVFRDTWIQLQSRSESLLFQKQEIGGALIGRDNALFTKLFGLKPNEEKQLVVNTTILQQFIARHPGGVTVLMAPSASLIYPEKLPASAPMLDEGAYLDRLFSTLGAENCLDLRQAFTANKDKKLYYDTDHHWTTEGGAYLAYQQFCRRLGLTPMQVSEADFVQVPDFYGTTYAKCVLWNEQPDAIHYLNLANRMTIWNSDLQGNLTPSAGADAQDPTLGLYDLSKIDTTDKYALFLHGNNGYTTIEGNGTGKLLVIKDSYANCLAPYLTENYAQIGVIDPRGYSLPIDDLMEKEGYDQVLLVFNFQTFVTNNNLSFMADPPKTK